MGSADRDSYEYNTTRNMFNNSKLYYRLERHMIKKCNKCKNTCVCANNYRYKLFAELRFLPYNGHLVASFDIENNGNSNNKTEYEGNLKLKSANWTRYNNYCRIDVTHCIHKYPKTLSEVMDKIVDPTMKDNMVYGYIS